jgi:protein SCO1/2
MKRYLSILLPLGVLGIFMVYFLTRPPSKTVFKKLPILGNHRLDTSTVNGTLKTDTVFHSIPDFKLTNQDGKIVDQSIVAGKVYVADYFFTTCTSICPVMSNQLERVARSYSGNPKFMILSHSVDPETDTPELLREYAKLHHAKPYAWVFLTGDKKALYDLARTGYLLDAQEGNGGPEDFIHTQNFALIDKQRRIRGYYDGTDSTQVNQLITDIGFLLQE